MINRNLLRVILKDLWAEKVTHIRMVTKWRGVLVEAEQHLFESSMEIGNIIMVVEVVTRVAQAGSGIIKIVSEAVEDHLLLIQMQSSIINTNNTENVKLNS